MNELEHILWKIDECGEIAGEISEDFGELEFDDFTLTPEQVEAILQTESETWLK